MSSPACSHFVASFNSNKPTCFIGRNPELKCRFCPAYQPDRTKVLDPDALRTQTEFWMMIDGYSDD